MSVEEIDLRAVLHSKVPVAQMLDVNILVKNPWQVRLHFDKVALIHLAEDIRQNGLIQPVVVRRSPETTIYYAPDGKYVQAYEIAAGQRRWEAFKLLRYGYCVDGPAIETEDGNVEPDLEASAEKGTVGIKMEAAPDPSYQEIPVILKILDDEEMMRICVSENSIRKDVSPMEEAIGFSRMLEALKKREPKLTQEEFARRMGISQPTVANRLRMMSLPKYSHALFMGGGKGKLGQKAANEILALKKKYNIPGVFVGYMIDAASAGTLSLSTLNNHWSFYTLGQHLPKGQIVQMTGQSQSLAKFDVTETCTNCEFFFKPLEGVSYCGRPEHFRLLNKETIAVKKAAEKEKAEEIKAQNDGRDVLRDSSGTALQAAPETDDSGVYILDAEHYNKLRYDSYKEFTLTNLPEGDNGELTDYSLAADAAAGCFDRVKAGCLSCQFYARLRPHGATEPVFSNGQKKWAKHICLKPTHFGRMQAIYEGKVRTALINRNALRAKIWREAYGELILAGGKQRNTPSILPPHLDKMTALMWSYNFFRDLPFSIRYNETFSDALVTKIKDWLWEHGLPDTEMEIQLDSYWKPIKLPVAWIEQELNRLSDPVTAGDRHNQYLDVVLTAQALVADVFIQIQDVDTTPNADGTFVKWLNSRLEVAGVQGGLASIPAVIDQSDLAALAKAHPQEKDGEKEEYYLESATDDNEGEEEEIDYEAEDAEYGDEA